jgi:hypothetical protein
LIENLREFLSQLSSYRTETLDHQEQEFVDDYADDDVSPQENQAMLLESTRLAIEDEGFC